MGHFVQVGAHCKAGRQDRHHRVAGAGNVENLAGAGRNMARPAVRRRHQQAVFAQGNNHAAEVQKPAHPLCALGHFLGGLLRTGQGCFELGAVGRQQAGAAIVPEIAGLRVHQDRLAGGAGGLDQSGGARQAALGVVGQHHGRTIGQQLRVTHHQASGILPTEGRFAIQPDNLLVAAQDPELADRGPIRRAQPFPLHPAAAHRLLQRLGLGVLAHNAQQRHPDAQPGQVAGDIGRAAGSVVLALDIHYRRGRLGGNTGRGAQPVLVEHDVARHQDLRFGEIGNHGIIVAANRGGSVAAKASIPGNYRNILWRALTGRKRLLLRAGPAGDRYRVRVRLY